MRRSSSSCWRTKFRSPGVWGAGGRLGPDVYGRHRRYLQSGAQIVFDATYAGSHQVHALRLQAAGMPSIDLTPAAITLSIGPVVYLKRRSAPDANLVSCEGSAAIPIINAIHTAGNLRNLHVFCRTPDAVHLSAEGK